MASLRSSLSFPATKFDETKAIVKAVNKKVGNRVFMAWAQKGDAADGTFTRDTAAGARSHGDALPNVSSLTVSSSSAPPAAIAALVGGHSTAKAAVEAGVDRNKIVKVAMEDGDVMAWLLATIPEYARRRIEKCVAPRLSPAALSPQLAVCVCLSLPLTPRVCAHTPSVFCVCCRVQNGDCRSAAAENNKPEAVIKALLAASDAAASAVRCGRGRRVLCPLLSLSSRVCVAVCRVGTCRSTVPLQSEAVTKAVLADPDAIKTLLLTCVCVAVCRTGELPLHCGDKGAAGRGQGGRIMCVVAAGGACCALALSLSSRVCVAVCRMRGCRSTSAKQRVRGGDKGGA